MIQTIIDLLDAAAGMHLATAVRHGIAELQPVEGGTQPVVYASDGSFVQIANDNAGSLSYWRLSGRESERQVDIVGSACGGFEVTMPLRFVAMVDRALCPSVAGAARSASWAMMDVDTSIVTATDAVTVDFTGVGVDTDSRRVYQQEFGTALTSTTKAWVAIDISVVVVGQAECFAECGQAGDFLCKLIEAKTWAQIKTCLTQAQINAAEADLCTSGTLCEVVNGADPSEVVTCIENDGDLPIYLGGILASDQATPDIIVEGILNAGKGEGVKDLLCDDCPETAAIQRTDSSGSFIGSPINVPCGELTAITCPDGTVQRKDSAGGNIGSPVNVLSNGSADVVCPDGVIVNKTPSPTYSLSVKSNGTEVLPKVRIAKRDGTTIDLDYLPTPTAIFTESMGGLVLRQYTNSDIWNKPTAANFAGIWLRLVGPGGGGGSGAVGVNATGGSGGGGGSSVLLWVPASSLGSSEAITMGFGGAGASSSSAAAGSTGSRTRFGTLAEAAAGGGGGAGSTSAGTVGGAQGGSVGACVPAFGPYGDPGAAGGIAARTNANASVGGSGCNGSAMGPGGGGGVGCTGGAAQAGRAGGGVYYLGVPSAGGGGGAIGTAGTPGANDVNLDLLNGLISHTVGLGTAGGGGGGAVGGSSAGAGGAGGSGAGGGGGGGCETGGTRGAGGRGGNGLVLIVEVYY